MMQLVKRECSVCGPPGGRGRAPQHPRPPAPAPLPIEPGLARLDPPPRLPTRLPPAPSAPPATSALPVCIALPRVHVWPAACTNQMV